MTDELVFLVLVVVGYLGVIVGAPVAISIWLEPRWRVAAFFLGLALAAGNDWLILAGHVHAMPILLLDLGLGIALAALLVEIPAFAIRTIAK